MKTIKVNEASGPVLDWMVAKCEDLHTGIDGFWTTSVLEEDDYFFRYSTDWAQGGPIIEREGMSLLYRYVTDDPFRWAATHKPALKNVKPDAVYGPTPLIAAMRCYCCSKLGDIIDVPEELCQSQNS